MRTCGIYISRIWGALEVNQPDFWRSSWVHTMPRPSRTQPNPNKNAVIALGWRGTETFNIKYQMFRVFKSANRSWEKRKKYWCRSQIYASMWRFLQSSNHPPTRAWIFSVAESHAYFAIFVGFLCWNCYWMCALHVREILSRRKYERTRWTFRKTEWWKQYLYHRRKNRFVRDIVCEWVSLHTRASSELSKLIFYFYKGNMPSKISIYVHCSSETISRARA